MLRNKNFKINPCPYTIPSGIFHKNLINVIGNGVVIDPVIFEKEILKLKDSDIDFKKNY